MSVSKELIAELQNEAAGTRKMLERVDLSKSSWKPHEKSMTLGRLATHIAELPHWINDILEADHYDFATAKFKPSVASDSAELIRLFDEYLNRAVHALENCTDQSLNGSWKVSHGERVTYTASKKDSIRHWTMNHIVHHRGQLSVYLRLLNIPVPGMYGPSADEK